MSKVFRAAWISCLVLLLPLRVGFSQENRINLAVAEFEARNVSQMDALAISDFVRTELVKSGLFKVLDRTNMDKVLQEQAFQVSGCTTQECAVQMGKILNVQKIVIGILTKLVDVYFITASVVDVQTGEIEFSERIKAPTAGELADSSEELGRVLASQLTGSEVKISRRDYTVSKNGKSENPYISKVISEKEAKINHGFYDGVKKRGLYTIYKGAIKIGKLKITSVGPEESAGKVIRLKAKEKIETGLPVSNKDNKNKWRAGGIGGVFGLIAGENLDAGVGGSLYYDCIFPSGWGFQLNLGTYRAEGDEYLNSYSYTGTDVYLFDDYYGDRVYRHYGTKTESRDTTVNITYSNPVILKRHIGWDNPVSPYIGIGLCQTVYKYEYTYNYTQNWSRDSYYDTDAKYVSTDYGSDTSSDYSSDKKSDPALLFNFGIDILATRTAHLVIDFKYFFGKKDWYGYKARLRSSGFGVSFNW